MRKINHLTFAACTFAACTVFAQSPTGQPSRADSMLPPGTRLASPAPMPVAQPVPANAAPPQSKVDVALEQIAPMNPEEITQLLKKLQDRRQAMQQNVTGRPAAKAVTSSEVVDLTPGAPPPLVRIATGEGAVVSFIDTAGRPWPIADNMNFNDRAFGVRLIGPHLLSVNIKTSEKANMAVVLKGLDKPIMFTVVPAQTETDYSKEFVIPGFVDGKPPASSVLASAGGASFNAPDLLNFLYRTVPANSTAKPLSISGAPSTTHAWQVSADRMVVRTPSMLVLPGWIRRHAASDGTAVYELPLSSVVTVSDSGVLHRVSISNFVVPSAPSINPNRSAQQ